MANGGSIKYNIGFNVDKSGLNELKQSFQELKRMTTEDFMKISGKGFKDADAELKKIKGTVKEVEYAFHGAFNKDLGTLNISKFNQTLASSGLNIQKIHTDLSSMGASGQSAFRNLTTQLLTTNVKLKETHSLLDSMATTMANTIKWGAASSVMNSFTGTVQRAYGYVKNLDSSLNDIRIVTGKSADEMDRFAEKANKAAKNLGQTTTNYTDAALIYYQQGLSDAEVQARAEVTLKAANVTGQSGAEVSEQLTAVWNGYKVTAAEAELYIDKLAAVAATTASDLEELSTGMSKVASAANLMGVDIDQLNAQLATIVSVTRQAPESVGTALKTIYARMGDIEAGLDSETTLGDYTEKMAAMGVNVLDMNGQLRDMGAVMEEIGGKWTSMSREQQIYLSQVMAGTRQYNNLLSLFDNWDQYTKSLETSANAAGTLQEQQDTYMESTQAHLAQLKASWEDLYDSLLDADTINGVSDALSGVVSLMANFVDSIGGGSNVLLSLGSIATTVFSKNMAQGIATTIKNFQNAKWNASQLANQLALLKDFKGINNLDQGTQEIVNMKEQLIALGSTVTAQQQNEANSMIQTTNEILDQKNAWEENKRKAEEYLKTQHEMGDDFSLDGIKRKKESEPNGQYEEIRKNLEGDIAASQEKVEKSSKEYAESIRNATEALSDFRKAGNELTTTNEELDEAERRHIETMNKIPEITTEIEKESEHVKKALGETSQEYKELSDAIAKYQAIVDSGGDDDAKIQAADEMNDAFQKAQQAMQAQSKQTLDVLEGEAAGMSQKWETAFQDAKKAYDNFTNNLKSTQIIEQSLKIVGGIGQMVSGFQSLINITNILKNDSISAGEKALQVISAITMALPMLWMGYKQAAGGVITLAVSLATQAVASKDVTASTIAQTIAETAATGATIGFGTAVKFLTIELWKLLAPFAPIIAAIGALGVAIYAVVKAQEAEAEAAKRASENLSTLTERYNELTEAVKTFKEEASSYEDAVKALEELDYATEEYKKKLEEANAAAKNLIETHKLYDKYSIDSETGLITFDKGVLEGVQSQIERQQKEVEINKSYAQIGVNNTNIDKQASDITNRVLSYSQYVPGTETVEGSPETREIKTSYLGTEDAKEIAQAFYAAYKENGEINSPDLLANVLQEHFSNLAYTDFSENEEIQKDLLELGKSMEDATASNKYYAKEAAASALELEYASEIQKAAMIGLTKDGGMVSYAGREQAITNAVVNKVANEIDSGNYEIETVSSNNDLNKKYGYKISGDEDLAREYAKTVLKYTEEQVNQMEYEKGNNKGQLTLNGENILGDEQLSDDTMRAGLAQAAAAKEATSELLAENRTAIIENFAEIATRTDEIANGAGTSITNAILNAMDYNTENGQLDFSSAYATMSPWENEALKAETANKTPDELAELLGLSQENFEAMGYSSAEEFKKAFDEQLENYDEEAFEQNEINAINKDAEAEGFKTEEVDAYAETIKETAEASELLNDELKENDIAAQQVAKQIMKLNRGVETLGSDWENWSTILKDSDEGSQEYSEALNGVKGALADIADTSAEYISNDFVQEHLEEIGKAAEGDAEAIDALRIALAEKIVAKISIDNDLSPEKIAEFTSSWNTLSSQLQDIEVGVMLSGEDTLITSLNDMILAAGMTTTQVNDLLGSMGFSATFASEPQKVSAKIPITTTVHQREYTAFDDPRDPSLPTGWIDKESSTTTYEDATGEYTSFAMATAPEGEQPKVPKIETITRSSSGSTGNYSSSNSGGAKSPGGSKKSGGGSKPKEPDKMDPLKDERDRYHDINNELKKLNTQLERQDRITSKLTGADRIKALNKQLDILESQKAAQQAKLNLLKDEQNELKNSLQGQGVGFNGNEIADFNGALAAKEAYVNSLIEQYNGMSAEEQEAFKETIEQAKEDYEQFKEDMERYEEIILDEIPEAQDAINEAFDKQIELQIEAMEIEIELKLDLQDAKRQLEEFLSDIFVEDNDYVGKQQHIVNQIPTYLEDEKGTVAINQAARDKALQAYETIKAGGIDDVYGDDAAKAWEDVLKYQDATMDAIRDAKAALEEVEQLYLDGIDAANEAFDEHLEKYEDINDELEHYLRVTELLKGEDAYEEQIAYYDQMETNNIARMDFLRGEVAFWEEQMAKEEEGSDAWKKAQENAIAAQKELNNLVEESIEIAQKKFEATVKSVMKSIADAATDGMGLDYVKEQWELINKEADMYLDKINGAYEIGKLESKMLKALDNTSNVKSRERISELMNDELGKLREKDKLSQYEVDRANALFDLELKKIALEEAQRNKSTMRLRRDSQGNYTYQYTSDNDAIADAQAEVDEAQNALYNLDLDAYKDNLDKSLELFDEWQAKRQEIMIKYAGDEEKMKEHLALVDKEYEDMITFNTEQNEIIRKNLQQSTFESLAEMRDLDIEDFNNMTFEEQRIIMESMVPFWNTGVQAMTDKFAGKDDSFIEVCKSGFTRLDEATQAYKTSLDAIGEAAGVDLGAISSGQQTVLEEIRQLQTENSILFDQYDTTLGKLRENVEVTKEWVERLQDVAREAENAMNKVIALRQQEINNLGGGGSSSSSGSSGGGSNNGGSGGKGFSSSSNKTGSSGGDINGSNPNGTTGPTSKTPTTTKKEEHATVIGYVWIKSGADARIGKLWSNGAIQYKTTIPFTSLATHPIYSSASQAPRSFKTGGYTGAWANGDSEGKFALLHQKELVLNAKDTANILDAVNLVRGLEDSLNSRMFNLTNASALDKLYNLLEEKMSKEEATQMEQNIHIEANFPGVSVEKEISDAFDSLITKMSQKMYSTKR